MKPRYLEPHCVRYASSSCRSCSKSYSWMTAARMERPKLLVLARETHSVNTIWSSSRGSLCPRLDGETVGTVTRRSVCRTVCSRLFLVYGCGYTSWPAKHRGSYRNRRVPKLRLSLLHGETRMPDIRRKSSDPRLCVLLF